MLEATLPADDDRVADLEAVCSASLRTLHAEVEEEQLDRAIDLLNEILDGSPRGEAFLIMMMRWFRAFEADELARRFETEPEEMQDALDAMVDIGVVEGRTFEGEHIGRSTTYSVNRDHPLVSEIAERTGKE